MKRRQRVMGRVRTVSILAVGLWGAACAGGGRTPAAEPTTAVVVDVRPHLDRLRTVSASSGGQRPLQHLDVTGDGRVDAADEAVFDTVRRAAAQALGAAGMKVGPRVKLYGGAPEKAPAIFGLVGATDAGVDLSSVPPERLEELAVESRWAAQQTRFGTLLPAALEGTFGGALHGMVAGYNQDRMEPAALCTAIEQLDTKTLVDGGVHPIAIFDIDSTIWGGNVTDVFLATLADLNLPKPETNDALRAFLKTVDGVDAAAIDAASVADNARLLLERATNYDIPEEQRVSAKDAFYNIVGLIEGLTRDQVSEAARHAMEKGAGPYPPWKMRVFDDRGGCGMRRILTLFEQRGVEVYLLSATLDILAEIGGEYLGVPAERVIGSALELEDGVYTGEVKDSTYYTKGAITRQWLPNPPLFAFGDSPTSDFPMLQEAAAVAFMINARDRFIERDAKEAGSRMVAVFFDGTEEELAAGGGNP